MDADDDFAQLKERLASKRARYAIQRDDTVVLVGLVPNAQPADTRGDVGAPQTFAQLPPPPASACNEGIDSWEAEAIRSIAAAYEDAEGPMPVEQPAAPAPVREDGIDSWEAEAIRSIAAAYEDAEGPMAVKQSAAAREDGIDSWEAEAIRSIAAAYDDGDDGVAPSAAAAVALDRHDTLAADAGVLQRNDTGPDPFDDNAAAGELSDMSDCKIVLGCFVVDSFGRDYSHMPVAGYVLSHFHSDHYGGLRKTWNKGAIYCTEMTGRLVVSELGVDARWISSVPLHSPVYIAGVRVTLFDANHCPGAAMILFERGKERVLHVGDFRYTPLMKQLPGLRDVRPRDLSAIYLDTTFNMANMCFPPQDRVIEAVVERVAYHIRTHAHPLFVFGSYTIGKERVFMEVQRRCGGLVYASARKRRIFRLVEMDMSVFTSDVRLARYRVCGMADAGFQKLEIMAADETLKAAHDAFIGIAPSGWEWQRVTKKHAHERPYTYRSWQTIHCYGFPYSEHSSFEELVAFVAWLQPRAIVPTVFGGGRTKEAVAAQLVPFHKYIDCTKNKSTLFAFFSKVK